VNQFTYLLCTKGRSQSGCGRYFLHV